MTNLLSAVLLASNLWIQATGYIHSVIYYDDLPNTNCQMTYAVTNGLRVSDGYYYEAITCGTLIDGEFYTNTVSLIGISFSTITNATQGDNSIPAWSPWTPDNNIILTTGVTNVPCGWPQTWSTVTRATEKWVREVVIFRKTAKVLLDGEPFTITKDVQLSDTTKRWRLKQDWEPVVETNRPVTVQDLTEFGTTNWVLDHALWETP